MGRRTKDERKDDYLDIGASIVAESTLAGANDPGLALAHVKLADVAERAGVTKGALYHLWPSQEAFWHDLLHHLLSTNQLFGAEKLATVGAELAASHRGDRTLRDFADELFEAVRDDPAFFARVSLFSYLDDELVRTTLDGEFRSAVHRLEPVLRTAIADMGRQPRSPSAIQDLAVQIGALLEGMCLKYRVDPQRTPDLHTDGRRRTLFGAGARALVLAFTEPAGHAGQPHEVDRAALAQTVGR